jgi:hypothetical protein
MCSGSSRIDGNIVSLPTDVEIAIGAGTLNDGVWVNVFEKAIGTIYLTRQKTQRHVTPYDIIGVGGTPSSPLSILTGHACKRMPCADFQKGKLTPAERDAKLAEIRQELTAAFQSGRLVVGGTASRGNGETIVPGLYYNHSYGVLAFDSETDVVTFWNPMGNHFTPAGDPGLVNGYPTSHGRFDVPLMDAVMWFGAFSMENDQPATKPPGRVSTESSSRQARPSCPWGRPSTVTGPYPAPSHHFRHISQ